MWLCTESIKSIQCKEWHESQWSVCTWVRTAWQLPSLPSEEGTVTGTGAAGEEGGPVVSSGMQKWKQRELSCSVELSLKRGEKGIILSSRWLISCKKKWFGDFWKWAGEWESVDTVCGGTNETQQPKEDMAYGMEMAKLATSSLW